MTPKSIFSLRSDEYGTMLMLRGIQIQSASYGDQEQEEAALIYWIRNQVSLLEKEHEVRRV